MAPQPPIPEAMKPGIMDSKVRAEIRELAMPPAMAGIERPKRPDMPEKPDVGPGNAPEAPAVKAPEAPAAKEGQGPFPHGDVDLRGLNPGGGARPELRRGVDRRFYFSDALRPAGGQRGAPEAPRGVEPPPAQMGPFPHGDVDLRGLFPGAGQRAELRRGDARQLDVVRPNGAPAVPQAAPVPEPAAAPAIAPAAAVVGPPAGPAMVGGNPKPG